MLWHHNTINKLYYSQLHPHALTCQNTCSTHFDYSFK